MKKQRHTGVNSLLAALSAALALVIGEWLIHTFMPQKTLYPRYQTTPDYRLIFPANTTLEHAQGDLWTFSYRTNELGHRGNLLRPERTRDTTNVVALGDSFTFGMGIPDNTVYTDTLAELLGNGFSVHNAGMAGWGIDSEIKRYYEVFAAYKPRYVILQFTQNDPHDSITGVTEVVADEFRFSDYAQPKPWWQQLLSDSELLQKSQLYAAIRTILENIKAEPEDGDGLQAAQPELEDRYAEMLELLARQIDATGGRLLFLSVTHRHPDLYHYDSNHFSRIELKLAELEAAGLLHVVDLPLDQLEAQQGSLEGHQWNVAHHRIVGAAVAGSIKALENSSDGSGAMRSARQKSGEKSG